MCLSASVAICHRLAWLIRAGDRRFFGCWARFEVHILTGKRWKFRQDGLLRRGSIWFLLLHHFRQRSDGDFGLRNHDCFALFESCCVRLLLIPDFFFFLDRRFSQSIRRFPFYYRRFRRRHRIAIWLSCFWIVTDVKCRSFQVVFGFVAADFGYQHRRFGPWRLFWRWIFFNQPNVVLTAFHRHSATLRPKHFWLLLLSIFFASPCRLSQNRFVRNQRHIRQDFDLIQGFIVKQPNVALALFECRVAWQAKRRPFGFWTRQLTVVVKVWES